MAKHAPAPEKAVVVGDNGIEYEQLETGEAVGGRTGRDMIMIGGQDWHHVRELPDGRWVYRYDR